MISALDFSGMKRTPSLCISSIRPLWTRYRVCFSSIMTFPGPFLLLLLLLTTRYTTTVSPLLGRMQVTGFLICFPVSSLQGQIQRQMEEFRSLDEPHGSVFASTRPYFSNVENAPVSPRQMPQDDPRRSGSTLTVPGQPPRLPTYNNYRPAVPSNLSISTPGRRPFGSTSGNSTGTSPSSLRPHPPPPPPHPLSSVDLHPGLARRHTSADIRAAGWQANPPPPNPPPTFSGPPSSQWPSSPNRPGLSEDQRIRDSFSHYSLQSASHPRSRPASPPPPPTFSTNGGGDTFGNWSWNSAGRDNKNLLVRDHSAPPTRRGSMAHILNPTDTAERDDEDEDPRGDEDRKRKRLI